ncbi:thyrotropin-releasing hormone-degrading ectoenzyme [Musca domestica]|uniref:Aminopeptidase n=1 Tax=Musca domestica TaxID=7370 RepID=A0A9J7CNC8_MUSDO|nr:thyrotropin-releasing hormone-degrading ectoenzyme [Musca domestica]
MKMKYFILILVVFSIRKIEASDPRLPTAIRPDYYELKIITHLENATNLTFHGDVLIRFKVWEDTTNVTLHVRDLVVNEASIQVTNFADDEDFCLFAENVETLPELDFYNINFDGILVKGRRYELYLEFTGNLNRASRGYFYNSYVDVKTNQTRWISFTDFEPIYARSVFPCLDEPNYKAKFKIWLGHHHSLRALSNMPLHSQFPLDNSDGYVWSVFDESLPMSTYLVAFSINDFAYRESKSGGSNVVFRTWCREEYVTECSYALNIASKILGYFEKLFGVPFPLPKIDIVAVPKYGSSAMENWGLITLKESILRLETDSLYEWSKNVIISVMSHELVHQWFGNLVTMKWWNDVWIKEGFATYFHSLAMDYIMPGRDMYLENSIFNAKTVFQYDAEINGHPLSNYVRTSDEIVKLFDSITYQKASSAIRMLHLYMGSEAFFGGLQTYLARHQFGNAQADDLWDSLASAALKYKIIKHKHELKIIMDSWTLQAGYPVVTVKRIEYAGAVEISQQRFSRSSGNLSSPGASSCWWVPITYTTANELNFNDTTPKAWMPCNDDSDRGESLVLYNVITENQWVIFNIQVMAIYRVNYDVYNWKLIANFLKNDNFEQIPLINRIQLLSDVIYCARSGHIGYAIALNVMEYQRRERETMPWLISLHAIRPDLNLVAQLSQHHVPTMAYMHYLLQPIYSYLISQNETEISSTKDLQLKDLKTLVIQYACFFGLQDCVHTALSYFQQWKTNNNNPIPDDWILPVYCTTMRYGDENEWNYLWDFFNNTAPHDILILKSLACTQSRKVLTKFLDIAFNKKLQLPMVFAQIAFESVASNPAGTSLALKYLIENASEIQKDFSVPHLLSNVASFAFAPDDLSNLCNFMDAHPELFEKHSKRKRQILDEVNQKRLWAQRNLEEITTFMTNRLLSLDKERIRNDKEEINYYNYS